MNVIFQNEAVIRNVRDWKRTAADWELIMSSITSACGERPEEVEVVGAQNGSIIITLCASVVVTKMLATISKHIASIANDYVNFQKNREELQQSRMLSEVIARDLTKQEEQRRKNGKIGILKVVRHYGLTCLCPLLMLRCVIRFGTGRKK
ncbi:MAG: hypothetical protein OXC17_14260, partial [Aestuariivita sp.]|nr:hypothetical protein [Aestuariivita sp.]